MKVFSHSSCGKQLEESRIRDQNNLFYQSVSDPIDVFFWKFVLREAMIEHLALFKRINCSQKLQSSASAVVSKIFARTFPPCLLQDLGTMVEQLARFLGVSCDKAQLESMVESCHQLIEHCCSSEALSMCRGECAETDLLLSTNTTHIWVKHFNQRSFLLFHWNQTLNKS